MAKHLRPIATTDTVIVGNGPSALILSYILHGNIPIYNPTRAHFDPLLHEKLKQCPNLLSTHADRLTEHFAASRFSYTTQALPINVLLDSLIRPLGDTEDIGHDGCVRWEYDAQQAIDHAVIGNTSAAGGQWVDNPVNASWDIETLSYARMFSLPGYSFAEHYRILHGKQLPSFLRPSRREVAAYLAEYPRRVGIEDTLICGQTIAGVTRTSDGFYISSHRVTCRHLVLATGIFSHLISPRQLLDPLLSLPEPSTPANAPPLLVIGSGFTAADVIISSPPERQIIHIYKWLPDTDPSPLRSCHQQAYPEYAGVYRRMRLAARSKLQSRRSRPRISRSASSAFEHSRDWDKYYEGLPNTAVIDVTLSKDDPGTAVVTFQSGQEVPFVRKVSGLAYVIGRRGSLSYLDPDLQTQVCNTDAPNAWISGETLRQKAMWDTEVAENVFIIGSLTGDSLVRFAYGGCTYAAGKIMARQVRSCASYQNVMGKCEAGLSEVESTNSDSLSRTSRTPSTRSSPHRYGAALVMNGLDGHNIVPMELTERKQEAGSISEYMEEPR